jgi:hypothetical protein
MKVSIYLGFTQPAELEGLHSPGYIQTAEQEVCIIQLAELKVSI